MLKQTKRALSTNSNEPGFSPGRRDALKAGLATATAFSFSGLTLFPARSEAAALSFNLVAESYNKTMVDGEVLTSWRFRDIDGAAPGPGVLAAGLVVQTGDTISINLGNNLTRPIRFSIAGFLENGTIINPGNNIVINFTAPAAGTYIFLDDLDGELGPAMGLTGPLVVMPAGGAQQLYPGGPFFDSQYTLVLSDFDDRLNIATGNSLPYDLNQFEANYFFVNGLAFPDTTTDSETMLSMSMGDDVAIRFVNTGLLAHPMHFHGYHVRVISRDRVVETDVIDKDTVLVKPGECVDVILPVTQLGIFPLHTHYIPGVTANGVYVNPYGGALVLMNAS